MFDDLRKDGETSELFQSDDIEPLLDAPKKKTGGLKLKSGRKFLGMTAFQRFIISALLMLMAGVVALAVLLVTGTIYLPL
jgi:hypothetical protein